MRNKRYIVLDDKAIEIGGTNLTLYSIIESRASKTLFVPCSQLTDNVIEEFKEDIWILGNTVGLCSIQASLVDKLLSTVKFFKIEFDYNYCPYRGNIPHLILGKQECDCPHGITGYPPLSNIYEHIAKNALHIFFMSEKQREIYFQHLPKLDKNKTSILSSCFSLNTFDLFKEYKNISKNGKCAILAGYGGWHSIAKGTKEAIQYCESNGLEYDILPVRPHEEHLKTLASYSTHVFLPIIDDTCPRCIIEARLMDVNVIANENCQHISEDWWKNEELTEEYVRGRPDFFWKKVEDLS